MPRFLLPTKEVWSCCKFALLNGNSTDISHGFCNENRIEFPWTPDLCDIFAQPSFFFHVIEVVIKIPGLETCTPCEFGSYATSSGMTVCEACSNSSNSSLWTTSKMVRRESGEDAWMEFQGATANSFCHCILSHQKSIPIYFLQPLWV